MALPVLKSVQDCADYSKTVEPFASQLWELPYQVLENIDSLTALKQLYVQTNPLISAFAFSVFLGFIFLIISEINRNYSQVDRSWSILPNLYIVHLAVWSRAAGLPHARVDLIAVFSCLWSARLTFNYWRRGGYNIGSEDYRWPIAKSYVNEPVWFVFNVTFISLTQSVLLFAFSCIPAYAIMLSTRFEPDVQPTDFIFLAVQAALVLSEWISDGQQYNYQEHKHQYYKDSRIPAGFKKVDLDRGFLTSGLFAYSRHPNFLAEQAIWFVLYLWSSFVTQTLYNWTFVGSGALMLLFQGSTILTEWITSKKYPEYREYQKQVGKFIPTSSKGYNPPEQQVAETMESRKKR